MVSLIMNISCCCGPCAFLYVVIGQQHLDQTSFTLVVVTMMSRMVKVVQWERQICALLQALVFSSAPRCSQVADVFFILAVSAVFYTMIYIVSREATQIHKRKLNLGFLCGLGIFNQSQLLTHLLQYVQNKFAQKRRANLRHNAFF